MLHGIGDGGQVEAPRGCHAAVDDEVLEQEAADVDVWDAVVEVVVGVVQGGDGMQG